MARAQPVLIFDGAPERSTALCARLLALGLDTTRHSLSDECDPKRAQKSPLAAIVLEPGVDAAQSVRVAALTERLTHDRVATLVWGAAPPGASAPPSYAEFAGADQSLDEIVGRVAMMARYGPMVRRMEQELEYLDRLARQLNRHFAELDQELRLAGRLQRDFLPQKYPPVEGLVFAGIFRPATWVSGDLYDVFRVDEHHVGFFIADAMGHGVAAGLMTMFLRQALEPKQIAGGVHRVCAPAEALMHLHEGLLRQDLPNQQFVTAVYGLIDTRDWTVRVARGGHPHPIHIDADGALRELRPQGGLLGLADVEAEFSEESITLQPGEKLLLYTDGVEEAFVDPDRGTDDTPVFRAPLREWARHPAPEFGRLLTLHLDQLEGSLHPSDDVTVLLVERTA